MNLLHTVLKEQEPLVLETYDALLNQTKVSVNLLLIQESTQTLRKIALGPNLGG